MIPRWRRISSTAFGTRSGSAASRSQSSGCSASSCTAGGELAAGGLGAGEHEAGDHGDDVVLGQALAVDLGLEQPGHEVVAGLGAAGGDPLVAVGAHLGGRLLDPRQVLGRHRRG